MSPGIVKREPAGAPRSDPQGRNEPLDGTSTPAPGDFAVTVAGGPVGFLRAIRVNAVRVIGATVTLTLAAAVQTGRGSRWTTRRG